MGNMEVQSLALNFWSFMSDFWGPNLCVRISIQREYMHYNVDCVLSVISDRIGPRDG